MALLSFPPVLPDVAAILRGLPRQSHPVSGGSVGLKMPDFDRYDSSLGSGWTMLRRYVLVFSLVALGLALSGCTRCGPIWDDWLHAPKSCRSDRL
jgi:hypothetical protein